MSSGDKPLVWLYGEIKTPPLTETARVEAGYLLRKLQQGDTLSMPHSRPMSVIAPRCHELRVQDRDTTWRIIYRTEPDAVVILEVFSKKTEKTPKNVIDNCMRRSKEYSDA